MPSIHVVGANGRSGLALVRALLARGVAVQPVVRDLRRWAAVAPAAQKLLAEAKIAELSDGFALRRALEGATCVVSTAHARTTEWLLEGAPDAARLVLLGSTRRFTRWLDIHGEGVLRGETAFRGSGRAGVMLHPTMIYGAEGEDNVQRLAALLKKLPLVPLPGGGRALVQPIHQDDLSECILAALEVDWDGPHTLVVAGPEAVPYKVSCGRWRRRPGSRRRAWCRCRRGCCWRSPPSPPACRGCGGSRRTKSAGCRRTRRLTSARCLRHSG